jgi:cellulose synthase/poly-beta-1,6-N-acetylglucosamine synthase-like glycosyltransferase
MLIYLIFIFSIYFGFLLACMVGWRTFSKQSKPPVDTSKKFVSVVIAVRNEEASMLPLLTSLRFQDFPHDRFEVIVVDDHSTDQTHQLVSHWLSDNTHIQCSLIPSTGHGKKHALTEGIQKAKGEMILTTDADSLLPTDWISRMVMSFHQDTSMVIGLVKIHQDEHFFSKLQAIEFNSVMGSGIALHSLGFPVMCNGASLAFRKRSFEMVKGYEDNMHIPSGDDEFLMRKLKKQFPGSIQSIHGPSVVSTQPQPSVKSFINQRLRWAGKWKANDSFMTRLLALFILIFQVSSILALVLLVTGEHWMEVGALIGLKFLLEGYFLFMVSKTLHQRFSMVAFVLLQVVYPFYVVMIGILSQLLDYEWKGRGLKSAG